MSMNIDKKKLKIIIVIMMILRGEKKVETFLICERSLKCLMNMCVLRKKKVFFF